MIAKIKFTKPEGTDEEMLAGFIYDAISSWGGQFRPDDPLFRSISKVSYITVNGKQFVLEQADD